MKISIKLLSMHDYLKMTIDTESNSVVLNSAPVKTDANALASKICRLASSWEKKYSNSSVLDGESFEVIIKNNGKEYKFEGKNSYPNNFGDFLELLREVKNGNM